MGNCTRSFSQRGKARARTWSGERRVSLGPTLFVLTVIRFLAGTGSSLQFTPDPFLCRLPLTGLDQCRMAVALRRPLPVAAPKTVAVLTHEWVASWHLVAHFDGTDGRNSAAALARVFQASDAARAKRPYSAGRRSSLIGGSPRRRARR